MKHQKHKILQIPRVRQEMLRTFFLVAIIPILTLGIFSTIHMRRQMTEHYNRQVKAEGIRVNSILFDITTSLYTSSESVFKNKKYILNLGTDNHSLDSLQALNELNETLKTLRQNTAAISYLQVFTDNPNVADMEFITSLTDYSDTEWYSRIGSHWDTWTCLNRPTRSGKDAYELALVHRIGIVSTKYTAYLAIHLDNNYLKNRLEQNQYNIITAVDDVPSFYASDRTQLAKPLPVPDDFDGNFYRYTGSQEINGTEMLSNYVTFRPYKTDNLFFICIGDKNAYPEIQRMTFLFCAMVAVSIVVPAMLILMYSAYFSNRIDVLKHAMHQASVGNYEIIDDLEGDDELKETFEDLKKTVELIYEKESAYYEAQIHEQQIINKQQEMEFKMLASQINPHFLYNTLETIRMQALKNGNRDVATSIKLLGKSMHYVLENTGTSYTTLTRELDYIKTYLTIQKLRFGDRVNATFEVEDGLDTDECRILPLLLQPIVENAVSHGLESVNEHGCITISIATEQENLVIRIADNGSGMDTDTLDALRDQVINHNPNDTKSIGLFNINQRIKLLYGETYGLSIDSAPDEGTTVGLLIPKKIGADDSDEFQQNKSQINEETERFNNGK